DMVICDIEVPYTLDAGAGMSDYLWSTGETTQTISVSSAGSYSVTVTDQYGCTAASGSFDITICNPPPPTLSTADATICVGGSAQLNASGALTYTWTPTTGLNNPNIANPIASPGTTTTYYVTGYSNSCNLIYNGDFSSGNTGFSTAYNYSSNLFPEGNYMIGANPNDYHSNFSACGDHTSGSGNMMIVNGSPIANQQVWCQTVDVVPNTDYAFSTWLTSVHATNPAVLQFSINGTLLGSPFTASSTTCQWNQFFALWNSGSNTSIDICIVNQNIVTNGNDFAIDDIYFSPLCPAIANDSVVVTVVPDPNVVTQPVGGTVCNGGTFTLSVVAAGGTPSLTYQWQSSVDGVTFNNIGGATGTSY
ncbi:MAG TPA: hypothetical protein PLA77_11780, partial [Bacteroidales bacterium]|nr:hypothetical protein [Bacteroidales bacterium]